MGDTETTQVDDHLIAPGRVLIAGVSGVVGFAAAKAFLNAGWDVKGLSRRAPARLGVSHLAVDLADRELTRGALRECTGVTRVVFAALYEKPGLFQGWYETDQMERNLSMLVNLYEALPDIDCIQHISLLQGTKAYGAHISPMRVPGREREPRHTHDNFYWLQEDYLASRQSEAGWTSTILRPQVVFGEAQGGNMNAIPAIGVYAALLAADGEPLHYPGGRAQLLEAVDADLVGRMLVWAATDKRAANQTFNVTNGDVFTMRNVWPVIADSFGMEVGDDVAMSMAADIPPRALDWARVVEAHDLSSPTSLNDFVGQSFFYADMLTGFGQDSDPPPALVSTVK
ncbi:MAG: NAD-dependent epimerase/dehydratase family protein, partial [Acidimicrobiales bacterium]